MTVSLSGLDLSFLRKNDPDAKQPGRYRLDKASGEMVPLHEWHRRNPNIHAGKHSDTGKPYFMPDVDAHYGGAWKSIIDGTEISSRSNWREHNIRNGVVDVGDNYWSEDGDDVRRTEKMMGYDPSLIDKKDDGDGISFEWKTPSKP